MGKDISEQALEAAAGAAAEEERDDGLPRTLCLSSGIVLELHPVSQAIVRRSLAKLVKPTVPMVLIKDKDREEENPDDPDYKQALEDWTVKQAFTVQKTVALMGTKILSIPDGMEGPDGETWHKLPTYLDFFAAEELNDPYLRYLAWLEIYAAKTEKDQLSLLTLPLELAGITEREVYNAVESFRNRAQRRADNRSATAESNQHRNSVPPSVRRTHIRSGGKGGC